MRYDESRPSVYAANTEAGDLSGLSNGIHSGDAPVGGGAEGTTNLTCLKY